MCAWVWCMFERVSECVYVQAWMFVCVHLFCKWKQNKGSLILTTIRKYNSALYSVPYICDAVDEQQGSSLSQREYYSLSIVLYFATGLKPMPHLSPTRVILFPKDIWELMLLTRTINLSSNVLKSILIFLFSMFISLLLLWQTVLNSSSLCRGCEGPLTFHEAASVMANGRWCISEAMLYRFY